MAVWQQRSKYMIMDLGCGLGCTPVLSVMTAPLRQQMWQVGQHINERYLCVLRFCCCSFWLMYCETPPTDVVSMATKLYSEAIVVPFMANFVVFAKRRSDTEAQLRVFCMTDDKMDKTLECQEHFREIARSRDVEVYHRVQHLCCFAALFRVTSDILYDHHLFIYLLT